MKTSNGRTKSEKTTTTLLYIYIYYIYILYLLSPLDFLQNGVQPSSSSLAHFSSKELSMACGDQQVLDFSWDLDGFACFWASWAVVAAHFGFLRNAFLS